MLDEHISTTLYPQPRGAMFVCSPAWRSSYRLAKAKHTYMWPEEVSSYGCWILKITEEQTWPVQAPGGPENRNAAESKSSNGTLNTTESQATAICRETARMRFTCGQNEVYMCMTWLLSLNFHWCGSPHLWVLPLVGLWSINWNLSARSHWVTGNL